MQASELIGLLTGVKQVGPGEFIAFCPVPAYEHHCLLIGESRSGDAVIRCCAGCDWRDVLAALGLSASALASHCGQYPESEYFKWRPELVLFALANEAVTVSEAANAIKSGRTPSAAEHRRLSLATGRICRALGYIRAIDLTSMRSGHAD